MDWQSVPYVSSKKNLGRAEINILYWSIRILQQSSHELILVKGPLASRFVNQQFSYCLHHCLSPHVIVWIIGSSNIMSNSPGVEEVISLT